MSILDDEAQRKAGRREHSAQQWSDVREVIFDSRHLLYDLFASLFKVFGFWSKFFSTIVIACLVMWGVGTYYSAKEIGDHEYTMIPFFAGKFPEQITPLVEKAMNDDMITFTEYQEIYDTYRALEAVREEVKAYIEFEEARRQVNKLLGK